MNVDSDKSKDGGQMARSAGVVSILTLASRVLGLVRDMVVAATFDKRATDAFYVANTIPNVLRRLLGEGALTIAFIPVFTEYREQRGIEPAREMLQSALGVVLLVLLLVVGAGVLAAPWVVQGFAYGLADDPTSFALTTLLTRLIFPFLLAVSLSALAMGVLNSVRHFAAPAASPVVLNAFIIAAALVGTGAMERLGLPRVAALAVGVALGGFAQLAVQLPVLARRGLLVAPRLGFRHPGVVQVARLMLPTLFGAAIYEINVILARQFASFLHEGAISYVYYATRLVEFPMGMFAAAIATVAMPNLSSHAAAGDLQQVKETYRFALRAVFFIILPATAGLAALAEPIAAVLFQRGHFTHTMAQGTGVTLLGFLVGLWAGAGVRQTVQVFYALQDTRTPVKVAAVSMLVYALCGWLFYRPLETFGLGLAVSCSSTANFLLLVLLLRRKVGRLGLRKVVNSAGRSALAAAGCGGVAFGIGRWGHWELGGGAPLNYGVLLLAVLLGAGAYVALCWLLRVPELTVVIQRLKRRLGR